MDETELTELFGRLGARDPAQWAHSQIKEGIPQLARFIFLRRAWKWVVDAKDASWIQEAAALEDNVPGGAIGPALRRLSAQGANVADLTTIAAVMQWRLLSALCYLLDDPENVEPEVKDIVWQLFQVDERGQPIAPMSGLYESVLETEPGDRQTQI